MFSSGGLVVVRFARVRIEDSSRNRFALNGIQRDFSGGFFPGGFFPRGFFPEGFFPGGSFPGGFYPDILITLCNSFIPIYSVPPVVPIILCNYFISIYSVQTLILYKWIKMIHLLQIHIHDKNVCKNVTRFPTVVAKFKMSYLTLSKRKFVIEFIMKHDSSKDCRIQFDKTFFIASF